MARPDLSASALDVRSVLHAVPHVSVRAGTIISASPGLARELGVSPGRFVGRELSDLGTPTSSAPHEGIR